MKKHYYPNLYLIDHPDPPYIQLQCMNSIIEASQINREEIEKQFGDLLTNLERKHLNMEKDVLSELDIELF